MIIFKEKTLLNEMAVACRKDEGYSMIIEVYSEDHGILGDSSRPAHAHIRDTNKKYLGKFAITDNPPRSADYVFDCDKKISIPSEYKKKIVEWAKNRNPEESTITNWAGLKFLWRSLHP